MKTRYFFITLCAALLTLLAGCTDDNAIQGYLDNFKISQSYIYFENMDGGETITLDVTATEDWYVTETDIPTWLTISPLSGTAGDYKLSLTSSAVSGSGEAEIEIRVGKESQFIHVAIGETVVQEATILEVLNGVNGATYLVSGTCTSIASTYYGNFYLSDDDGNRLYVYGTVDSGGSYNWDSFDISVGDYVTVQGPRSTYGTTVELVDATFISRVKNLIKVEEEAETIPADGGEATVKLTVSGNGWNVEIPEEDKSWLAMSSATGTDTLAVTFYAQPNEGNDRTSTVTFSTEYSGDAYTTTATITQKGHTVESSIADMIAAGAGNFTVTGYVTSISGTYYGNFYIKDYSGSVYIYGTKDENGNYVFEELGINEGDIVTVTGAYTLYNGTTPEMQNVQVVAHYPVTDISVAEFNEAEESTEVWYRLTATVSSIYNASYGNIYVNDGTTESDLYVYGLASGWGGGNTSFQDLSVEAGDEIVFVGNRGSYGTTIEAMNSFWVETLSKGAYTEVTCKEFNEDGVDGSAYRISGYISEMKDGTTYGNYYVTDYTGTAYVYGTLDADGNSKNFASLGINEGDIVTVTGIRDTYKETVELTDVTVNSYYNVTDVTVAEFNEKEVSTEVYYRLTGTVTSIASTVYGNLYLSDGSTTDPLYVYGLNSGWGAPSNTSFQDLDISEGDTITIVGTRGYYASTNTIEAMNSFWVSTAE